MPMADMCAMEMDQETVSLTAEIRSQSPASSTPTSLDIAAEFDAFSELSEPPSDFDEDVSMDNVVNTSRKRKAASTGHYATETLDDSYENELDEDSDGSLQRCKRTRHPEASHFERLPKETLNNIAIFLASDTALHAISLTCRTTATALVPENADHWRVRFLTRYDYPFVHGPFGFCPAYRLRRFVLSTLKRRFENGATAKAQIQLECIRDMVLEAYNGPSASNVVSAISKNLVLFTSPDASPWMLCLLSTPFWIPPITQPTTRKRRSNRAHHPSKTSYGLCRYGAPHALFDAIQVSLTYLLLSPQSALAHRVNNDRTHYNIANVYAWQHPLCTLFRMAAATDQMELDGCPTSANEKAHTGLRPSASASRLRSRARYEFDMHSILHIRNFWHRHLIDDAYGFQTSKYTADAIVENTYAGMASKLVQAEWLGEGRTPRKWESSVQEFNPDVAGKLANEGRQRWFGHYSCIHKWPKKREELEERQTCAADWSGCDPLMLKITTTPDSALEYWPGIFSSIPLLESSVPDAAWFGCHSPTPGQQQRGPYTFLRGLARFLDLDHHDTNSEHPNGSKASNVHAASSTPAMRAITSSSLGPTKYHPYLSLRLRGLIHPIPAHQSATADFCPYTQPECGGIPGWQRVIMVMYKPTTRYLVQVLERSMEDYGDPFTQMVPVLVQQINNALGIGGDVSVTAGGVGGMQLPALGLQQSLNAEQMEKAMKQILEQKVKQVEERWEEQFLVDRKLAPNDPASPDTASAAAATATTPPQESTTKIPYFWTSERIAKLEDEHIPPDRLAWDDIEYAYAYEGVITPGGKVMMGRWWRCASPPGGGVGLGLEVGGEVDGGAVEGDRERGPFVFWS